MGWGRESLIACVEQGDHQPTADVLAAARDAIADCATRRAIERASPEYGRDEFLLNVDAEGRPVEVSDQDLHDTLRTTGEHPALAQWFRIKQGQLLVARWLCHSIGLRHRTVHLLLDHPVLEAHMVVQVRSLDKHEAPGCFDLPVAGHVVGLDTSEGALATECQEELGLSLASLVDLRRVGAYEQALLPTPSGFMDVEHQTVYRARLTADGWLHASAADHEVAAIAAFSIQDLEAMIRVYPERVASGLKGSLSRFVRRPAKSTARGECNGC